MEFRTPGANRRQRGEAGRKRPGQAGLSLTKRRPPHIEEQMSKWDRGDGEKDLERNMRRK